MADQDATPGTDGVIDMLTSAVRVLLRTSGEGIFDVRARVRRLGRAYGVDADVLVLPDQAVLIVDGTARVVVAEPDVRLGELESATTTLTKARPGIPATTIAAEFSHELGDRTRHAWWLRLVGTVLMAVGFAPSVVPSVSEAAVSVVLGLVMGVVFVGLSDRLLAPLVPFAGAFAVSVLALWLFPGTAASVGPVALMVPALFVVIPGDYLSAAAGEMVAGRISAGAVRLMWALFLLFQLVAGVALGVEVAGTDIGKLFAGATTDSLPFWAIVLAWVPFTLGVALVFGARLRHLPIMTALTVGTYLVYAGVDKVAGVLTATFAAAALLGLVAGLITRRPGSPPRLVLVIGGFFALTVGSLGMRGLTAILGGSSAEGKHDLSEFVLLVPIIALGLIAGTLIGGYREPRSR